MEKTSKSYKKAEDNIKAVENRMFGLGHKNDL